MSQQKEKSGLAKFATPLIILATIIWGSSFVVMKNSVDVLPTFWLLAIRFTFSALVLAVVFIKRWKVLDRQYLIGGTVMGFCLFVAYTFQTYGLERTTPGKNAFFTAVYCVIVPFLYWVIAKRRPDKFNILAAFLCIAGIDGNGQTELIYGLTGLDKCSAGTVTLCGRDISHASIRQRGENMSHIPEDRHKHGLVLDFTLEQNLVLQRYREPQFQHFGFIRDDQVRGYAQRLIEQYDVRSGQGPVTTARSMSGGNQQKAIIAREVDRDKALIVAVQPTRGLDVGAIEYIHKQLVAERDKGKAVLLVSLELDEVMSLSDRILVMYEGEIVGELDPKTTTVQELGLYMAGAKRMAKEGKGA